jgi:hypothetical protein
MAANVLVRGGAEEPQLILIDFDLACDLPMQGSGFVVRVVNCQNIALYLARTKRMWPLGWRKWNLL